MPLGFAPLPNPVKPKLNPEVKKLGEAFQLKGVSISDGNRQYTCRPKPRHAHLVQEQRPSCPPREAGETARGKRRAKPSPELVVEASASQSRPERGEWGQQSGCASILFERPSRGKYSIACWQYCSQQQPGPTGSRKHEQGILLVCHHHVVSVPGTAPARLVPPCSSSPLFFSSRAIAHHDVVCGCRPLLPRNSQNVQQEASCPPAGCC